MVYDVPSVTLSLVFAGNAWRFEAQGSSIAITETIETTALNLRNATETAALLVRNATEAAALLSRGYEVPVPYSTGISLTRTTQTVSQSGVVYAPAPGTLPFTTSGTFETAKFRVITGGVLGSDLAASAGAGLVGFVQTGAGAIARTVQAKLRDIVSATDIAGFDSTGATDSSAALAAGFAAMGAAGGMVFIPNDATPLIDTNLNIPDNCGLIAHKSMLGRTFSAPNLNLYKPRISLNRAATITLNNSSELSIPIFAKNIGFSDTSAGVAAWTGTAVTLADNKTDQRVRDCLILGFDFAVSTGANTRCDRPRIERVQFDCKNGIYLKNCFDVPYVSQCHGFPWVTLESAPEAFSAHLKRPGSFLWLDGVTNDWAKITDCFNYGWMVGYRATSADSTTFLSCSADHPPGTADGSIGFLVEGSSLEPRLIACQSAGKNTGVYIGTTDINGRVFLLGCNIWETKEHAVHVVNGDVSIVGGGFRNTGGAGNGVYFTNTGTKCRLLGVKLNGFAIGIKTDSAGAEVYHDHCDFEGCTTPLNNAYTKAITAANPLALDGKSIYFRVAGTTNFNTLSNAALYAGKSVTLKFDSALLVSTTGNIKLSGGVAYSTTADDTLTVVSDGVTWFEVSRSVNA